MTATRSSQRVSEINLPRRAWTVLEVAAQLGVSYDTALELIHTGELGHIKAGRTYLIPVEELERFLADMKRGDVA